MTTMNLPLPEDLRQFVAEQASREGLAGPEVYIEMLIRRERKRRARVSLEAEIIKGLDSGPAREMTPEDWEELRRDIEQRIARRDSDDAHAPRGTGPEGSV